MTRALVVVDLAGEDLEWGYANVAEQLFPDTDKPFAVLSNLATAITAAHTGRADIAGLEGLQFFHVERLGNCHAADAQKQERPAEGQ